MTAPTVPVTIRIADFGGPAVPGITVTAAMNMVDYTADGVFVGTAHIKGVTDVNGELVMDLFPNAVAPVGLGTQGTVVRFTATMPGSRRLDVLAAIPNHACDLTDILVEDEEVGLTAGQLAVQQAQDYAAASAAGVDSWLADYPALRAYTGLARNVFITGYLGTAAPAGYSGWFVRDDSDTTSADNGGTTIVAANGKRWKRVFSGSVNVRWFGTVGDGAADDTAALQAAIDSGYQSILFPKGNYKVTSSLLVPAATGSLGQEWVGEGVQGPNDGTELHYTPTDGTPMVTQADTGTIMAGFAVRFMQFHGPGKTAIGGGSCFKLYSTTNATVFEQVMVRQFPGHAFEFHKDTITDHTAVENVLFNALFCNSIGGYCFWADGRVNATLVQPNFNKCEGAFYCVGGESPGKTQLTVLGLWWEGELGGNNPCYFDTAQLQASFIDCAWDGPNAAGETIFTITGSLATNLTIINNGQNGFLNWISDDSAAAADPFILPSPNGRTGGALSFDNANYSRGLTLTSRRPKLRFEDNDSVRNVNFRQCFFQHELDKLFLFKEDGAGATSSLVEFSMNGLHVKGNGQGRFVGGLGVGNSAAATEVIGKAVVKKIQVFDDAGVSLGFVPVYSSIT